jgi:steroid delta-isomerase-like uncharacterized protein
MSEERSEEIAEFARKLLEGWNAPDWDVVRSIHGDDFVDHTAPPGVDGLTSLRGSFDLFRTAFPDFKITLEDVLFDDEKAVWRWLLSGTHNGDFMGIPASGNKVTLRAMTIARINGGLCREAWSVADMMGLMKQLGAA